jgi:hypothetical protein
VGRRAVARAREGAKDFMIGDGGDEENEVVGEELQVLIME